MQYSFYLEEWIFLAIFVIQAKTTNVLEAFFAFAESLSTSASALKLLSHQRYFDHIAACAAFWDLGFVIFCTLNSCNPYSGWIC